jgi:hypothetical protein
MHAEAQFPDHIPGLQAHIYRRSWLARVWNYLDDIRYRGLMYRDNRAAKESFVS